MGNRKAYQRAYYEAHTLAKRAQAAQERPQQAEPLHPIAEARKARGLSQAALAVAMGLPKSATRRITGWEHGEAVPTGLYAAKLAEVLGFESADQVRQLCQQWIKRIQK